MLGDILRFLKKEKKERKKKSASCLGNCVLWASTIAVEDDQGQSPNYWSDDHAITRLEVLDSFCDAVDETQSPRLACPNLTTYVLIYHDRRE
jgi:hypothetical protein